LSEERGLRVPILSDVLGISIEPGKLFAGVYEPSTQWLSFILTIASELLRANHIVAIVTLTTPPSQIRKTLAKAIPNLEEHQAAKRFTIIDWYTWMTGGKSTERRSVETLGLSQFNIQDSKYQREDSPIYDFLGADNLSTFLKYNDERSFMQWLDKTVARMRELRGVRLYGFVKGFHSEAFYANLEAVSDGVIELGLRERKGTLENVFRFKSVKTKKHPTAWRTLRMKEDGLLELRR